MRPNGLMGIIMNNEGLEVEPHRAPRVGLVGVNLIRYGAMGRGGSIN